MAKLRLQMAWLGSIWWNFLISWFAQRVLLAFEEMGCVDEWDGRLKVVYRDV
jgi:hypothetical protein